MIPDSGNPNYLYAIDATGLTKKIFTVSGATNVDWEDIGIDSDGNIWIADTGDNSLSRGSYVVYKVAEPDPYGVSSTVTAIGYRFVYPDGNHDSEAMFVWQGIPYVIKKIASDSAVYAFPYMNESQVAQLSYAGAFSGGLMITGADISVDGRRLALINNQDYHWIIERAVGSGYISDFFTAPSRRWRIYFMDQTGEAIGFTVDGGGYSFVVASEEGGFWKITQTQ